MTDEERILFLLFVIFLLQNPVAQYFSIADYVDEIFTCLGWGVIFWNLLQCRGKWKLIYRKLWILMGMQLILVLGICGNLFYGLQKFRYAFYDIFAFSKFFCGLLCGMRVGARSDLGEKFKGKVLFVCKAVAIVQFALAIHEQIANPWFAYLNDIPYIRSIKLYYSTQTYLVAYSIFLLAILLLWEKSRIEKYVYGVILLVPVALTGRSKALGFIALFAVLLFVTKHVILKNPILVGGLCGGLAVCAAWNKIVLYFFDSTHYSPRAIILKDGIMLARKYFPFGTGFGTFCSPGASLGGSAVYDMLGMNYSTEYIAKAINDMYWGYMLGQFGFVGMLGMLVVIMNIVLAIWKLQRRWRQGFLAGFALIGYIIIASAGESPFFASYIMGFAFMLGMIMEYGGKLREEDFAIE